MTVNLYKHNEEAYKKIKIMLEKNNRVCIIHPTGTGKTIIAIKWLLDNKDKNCIFLAPTYSVIYQFKKNIEILGQSLSNFKNLSFEIYCNINKKYKITNNVECIVLDEFHRCGAKKWGKHVKKLLDKNSNAKVLGLSATPIRYLDNNKDMSDEIFYGNIASEITLSYTVASKILPMPIYINAIYSFKDDIDNIQNKIDKIINKDEKKLLQKRLNIAKNMLEKSEGLPEIFSKYISNKNGKFIIFCKDITHMKKMINESKEWFKKVNNNIKITEISILNKKSINEININNFENNNDNSLKLLFCVEMLNEGIHIKNIDGVIMLRPTSSPLVYIQQLGRALSSGNNSNPIIFDIVNNINSCDEIYSFYEDVKNELKKHYSKYQYYKLLENFKIIDEYKDFIQILKSIERDASYSWDKYYELAKLYHAYHNNLNIPLNFKTLNGYEYDENGVKLGRWISEQRLAYNNKGTYKHDLYRIEKLNDIDMVWNVQEYEWNKMYLLATNYYNHNNNLEIPFKFKTINGYEYDENGVNLGNWIKYQRQCKKTMSLEKLKKLNNIKMIWDVQELKDRIMLSACQSYYKKYKNLDITNEYITKDLPSIEDGLKLGSWISEKRRAYKPNKKNLTISKYILDSLNSLGMIWNKQDYLWNKNYELAKKYYLKEGNLKIPVDYVVDGIALGTWIKKQRSIYRCMLNNKPINGYLNDERIKKLNDIGMVWNIEKGII